MQASLSFAGVAAPARQASQALARPVVVLPKRAARQAAQRVNAQAVAAAAPTAPSSYGGAQGSTPSKAQAMDIVFISAEVAPWSKTGGLGDVVGGLPIALAQRGHRVFSIAPRYDQYRDAWDTSVTVNVMGEDVRFFHTVKKGVHRVWIDHPWFLSKVWGMTGSKLYGSKSGADYVDNQKRFTMFCRAALEAMKTLPFMPGEDAMIVCNDWHTAPVPVLLKNEYQKRGEFVNTKTAMCIHNIAFQGRFWRDSFGELGMPAEATDLFTFEDGYPKVFDERTPADENGTPATGANFAKTNWLKAGILACDKLLTVSPNYATEIASGPALGVELDKWVRSKGVEGIVNGMDVEEWSPALDKFLKFKYDATTVEAGKAFAKSQLQREAGLPVDPSVPVFGFIGRLEEQKGVDILLAALKKLPKSAPVQVVVLGTGKKALEAQVKALESRFPGMAAGVVKFDSAMAHCITAGADFMLVPSRFEPCGLIQLHAMQYGTVPLVASTGGLVDTVKEGVTGFQMGAFDPDSMSDVDAESVAQTMLRAAETYGTPAYKAMRDRCISQDLSWAQPAKKWEAVLTEMKFGPGPTPEASADKAAVTTPVQKI
ncbi:GBSSIb [Micractinium conductrix]|uniref:Starch synthase, chloroplastic/amyloplastic n=1 Tax=Micractinium conductrix TaxID=554055 RepID=A0A2P6VB29_9CHLO|nr:GBSSIb [Micractinium conductrix]|eukprot:PSC71300.1 GBSSIb [Micractinium conductrix]